MHPVRPWIAVGDEVHARLWITSTCGLLRSDLVFGCFDPLLQQHDAVAVWDFERRALVTRFTTQDLRERQLERERIQQVGSYASID